MKRILVVDNYDSFVYTIVGYIQQLGVDTKVFRNDAVTAKDIIQTSENYQNNCENSDKYIGYHGVLVSPGPGNPNEAGNSLEIIQTCLENKIPYLGVCLGHQALAQVCGGKVVHAPYIMHGKTSEIIHNNADIFYNLPNPLTVTRYHSIIVDDTCIPDCLEVTAKTRDNIIMALAHKEAPAYSVQFHPEAVMTQQGLELFNNWLDSF